MIPVWRYWTVLLSAVVAMNVYDALSPSLWKFAVVGAWGILVSVLLTKYTKKLVEVPR